MTRGRIGRFLEDRLMEFMDAIKPFEAIAQLFGDR